MDLPLKQGPKGEVKPEVEAGGTAASSVEQTGSLDGEPCGAQSAVCKVHFPKYYFIQIIIFFATFLIYPSILETICAQSNESILLSQDEKSDLTRNKTECEPSKTEAKDSRNDDEDEGPLKGDADEGSSTAHLGVESVKQECDEEQESKDNSG